MKTRIIVDSTADLMPEFKSRVHTVPLTVNFGDEEFIDGEISVLGKARGSKMGNNLLVQQIDKVGGIDFNKPVLLGYSGISDALLLKYIEDSRHIWEGNLDEVRYTTVGSVIGTHAGPGAVVVAFFKK